MSMISLSYLWRHLSPNLTIGAQVIESLRGKHTKGCLDCHLMVTILRTILKPLAKAGASGFIFFAKLMSEYWQTVQAISQGMRPGVALKPGTPVEEVFSLVEAENPVELVLVMTVEPGFGGQEVYATEMMDKVRTLKKYPALDIELTIGLGLRRSMQQLAEQAVQQQEFPVSGARQAKSYIFLRKKIEQSQENN
ncbi:ribulose-phosphate 3-epimerase, cytoplasmic isoform-like [Typha latifolia]|uniref:ribulose-phosphate 3-epimerase, cytoplasmic isoform-like n=1 Tax=Typha latifolia TaxID=4733 RepID=UPI003C2DC400